MNVHLVVVRGRPQGMEVPVPMQQFLIGRDPKCHLRPNNELISKVHCALLQRGDAVFVRDLKSTNGTYVNNDRIEGEVRVRDGDLLRVGPLVFAIKVEVPGPSGRSHPAAPAAEEENQALSWLLDYAAGSSDGKSDLGAKTTVMDMQPQEPEPVAREVAAKPVAASAAAPAPDRAVEAARKRAATAEIAGDLLDKLLETPRRKKRP